MTDAPNSYSADRGTRAGAARLKLALAALGMAGLVTGCNTDDGMMGRAENETPENRAGSAGTAASTPTAPGSMGTTGGGTGGSGGWGEAGGAGGVGGSGGIGGRTGAGG